MRAQRAFNDFGIPRADRPLIAKTNIVIAEPMPGEQDLLEEFLRELREDRLEGLIREALAIPPEKTVRATKAMADSLADLVRAVWNGMELAGELGSLLKIELRLQDAIAEGQKEWEERLPLFRIVEYGLGGETKEKLVRFVEGRDNDFWSKAEQLTLNALRRYAAKQTMNGGATARRLFAEDAEHGFALIDLCRKQFDVVLMNPPFGDPPVAGKEAIFASYGHAKTELYAAFTDRALMLAPDELVGCLASRTGFFLVTLEQWRRESLLRADRGVDVFFELGEGVLDAAVECACFVTGGSSTLVACGDVGGASASGQMAAVVQQTAAGTPTSRFSLVPRLTFATLPGATFGHQLPAPILRLFRQFPNLGQRGFVAKQGIGTSDNFRFLRLRWEVVPAHGPSRWWRYAKGGSYSPFFSDSKLVLNWADDGNEVKAYSARLYGSWSKQITNTHYFGSRGLTYASRTHREFAPSILPGFSAFDTKGCCIFSAHAVNDDEWFALLGITNSRVFSALLRVGLARLRSGLARQYNESLVMAIPLPDLVACRSVAAAAFQAFAVHRKIESTLETSSVFEVDRWLAVLSMLQAGEAVHNFRMALRLEWEEQIAAVEKVDRLALQAYFPDGASTLIQNYLNGEIGYIPSDGETALKPGQWNAMRVTPYFDGKASSDEEIARVAARLVSVVLGLVVARWETNSTLHDRLSADRVFDPLSVNGGAGDESGVPILVDDRGAEADIVGCIERYLEFHAKAR